MTALSEEYQRRLGIYSDVQDCMKRYHATAAAYPAVAVLELGVATGNSTSAFLAAAEATGGHVWSVDLVWNPLAPQWWKDSGYWTLFVGDDLQVQLPDRQFDVVYIDTSHTFDHTLAELHRFVPMVAPGGTVLLHDTHLERYGGRPGPPRPGPASPYPVTRALDAFCAQTGLAWEDDDCTEYGIGEIAQPNG
jgi:predicted O-methyltransferase YrrM